MTVYKKLSKARLDLLSVKMEKSGHNKFAGFHYFELGDFIPHIHKIFNDVGLVGVFCFEGNNATLTVHDTDGNGSISFVSPVVAATKVEKDGSQKPESIQDLGAKHTYMRRYLWLMAMEITEHDAVDAGADDEPKQFKQEKEEVTSEGEDRELFVTKMIDWANEAQDRQGLTSLWKSNQSKIDEMKKNAPALFKQLQGKFAEIKSKFGE